VKGGSCTLAQRALDLSPGRIGGRVQVGRVQLLQLVSPKYALRGERRPGGRDELSDVRR
jgi:hypothetical protein